MSNIYPIRFRCGCGFQIAARFLTEDVETEMMVHTRDHPKGTFHKVEPQEVTQVSRRSKRRKSKKRPLTAHNRKTLDIHLKPGSGRSSEIPGTGKKSEKVAAPEKATEPQHQPKVEIAGFELLPPGSWDIEHIVSYYSRPEVQAAREVRGRELDITRLWEIRKRKPEKCIVGTRGWIGYILFYEFPFTKKAVLECPVKGNATYVLSGNWRHLLGKTKLHLRTRSPNVDWIRHSISWANSLFNALIR